MEDAARRVRADIATVPPDKRTPPWEDFRTDAGQWALALADAEGLADA